MAKNSSDLSQNPLVNPPKQPFNAPPLGLFKMEHVEPALDHALEVARKNIDAITNNPDEPTFENTIHAMAFAGELLGQVLGPFFEILGPLKTKEAQDTQSAILPKLSKYGTEQALNTDLFKRVETVYNTADRSKLTEEENILLEKTYNGFKNNGVLLTGKKRETYKELSQKLSQLTADYGNNISNSSAELKVVIEAKDKDRLKGIPTDTIATYAENAKNDPDVANDAYVITMTDPLTPLYEYAEDRSLREEVKRTAEKIASESEHDNTQVVKDILETRHKLARLLGFKNHAERTIRPDTRMTEQPQTAMDFVKNNAKTYRPVARKFDKELEAFAKEKDGIEKLERWDRLYYINKMREEQIGYDPEETRPYFEMENVLQGMFDHAEKLYGIRVQETDGKYSKMHEDVRTYEILDAESGDVKALYFLDPYARKHKNGGAWMSDIRNAGLHNGKQEIPIAGNYCNFTKPAQGNPTLLTDNDVITLFHEFGHGCHGMMGKGTYPDLSGVNTPWDYVELPSQINERWAFKPEVLKAYAVHHETGEPMPDHLIEKLQTLHHFDAQWQGKRQTDFGLLDMETYTRNPAYIKDLKAFQDKVWKAKEPDDAPPMILTFGHIMAGGYSAGYHSYKWADALVADVFEQFEEQGLYKESLCKAFRESMIEPGGTRAPSEMHKDFMEAAGQGRRDLDQDALYRYEGLLPPKPKGPAPKP